jgi:hypothetical protein
MGRPREPIEENAADGDGVTHQASEQVQVGHQLGLRGRFAVDSEHERLDPGGASPGRDLEVSSRPIRTCPHIVESAHAAVRRGIHLEPDDAASFAHRLEAAQDFGTVGKRSVRDQDELDATDEVTGAENARDDLDGSLRGDTTMRSKWLTMLAALVCALSGWAGSRSLATQDYDGVRVQVYKAGLDPISWTG